MQLNAIYFVYFSLLAYAWRKREFGYCKKGKRVSYNAVPIRRLTISSHSIWINTTPAQIVAHYAKGMMNRICHGTCVW